MGGMIALLAGHFRIGFAALVLVALVHCKVMRSLCAGLPITNISRRGLNIHEQYQCQYQNSHSLFRPQTPAVAI